MCKSIKILPKKKNKICYCNKIIPNSIWENVYKKFLWNTNFKKVINKRNMLIVLLHVSVCNGCDRCNKESNKNFIKYGVNMYIIQLIVKKLIVDIVHVFL